jgi:tryptophan synthase beta chain
MDLSGYDKYMTGKLSDYELPEDILQQCAKDLENMPKAPMRKSGRW